MKLKLNFVKKIGVALFITNTAMVFGIQEIQFKPSLSAIEIQEFSFLAGMQIDQQLAAIYAIPAEERKFENTLQPCNQLVSQLFNNYIIQHSFFTISVSPTEAIESFDAYIAETLNSSEFFESLREYAQFLNDSANDAFQKYIASRFIDNSWHETVHLPGSATEKPLTEDPFTLLGIDYTLFQEDPDLPFKSDILYIYNLATDEEAHQLYQLLEKNYAHFMYQPSLIQTTGMLVASNYALEDLQFPKFFDDMEWEQEETIDPFDQLSQTERNGTYSMHYCAINALYNRRSHLHKGKLIANRIFEMFSAVSKGKDDHSGGSVEFGADIKIGGQDGVKVDPYIKGEVHDDKGNYAGGKITTNDDGSYNLSIRGGHAER